MVSLSKNTKKGRHPKFQGLSQHTNKDFQGLRFQVTFPNGNAGAIIRCFPPVFFVRYLLFRESLLFPCLRGFLTQKSDHILHGPFYHGNKHKNSHHIHLPSSEVHSSSGLPAGGMPSIRRGVFQAQLMEIDFPPLTVLTNHREVGGQRILVPLNYRALPSPLPRTNRQRCRFSIRPCIPCFFTPSKVLATCTVQASVSFAFSQRKGRGPDAAHISQ